MIIVTSKQVSECGSPFELIENDKKLLGILKFCLITVLY